MSTPQTVESHFLAEEKRCVQEPRALDLRAIDDILAEKYRQTRPDGAVIDKKQVMSSYKAGNRRWEAAESDEHEIQAHGNVAILIGRWIGRGYNQGERFDYQARFFAIYMQKGAGWKLTFDQSTPIDRIHPHLKLDSA